MAGGWGVAEHTAEVGVGRVGGEEMDTQGLKLGLWKMNDWGGVRAVADAMSQAAWVRAPRCPVGGRVLPTTERAGGQRSLPPPLIPP